MKGDETRERIKLAARRLFAERGVDGVSIREIVAAAGQRNVGSLHYYFRTKEALVRELVIDGTKAIDDRRNVMLDGVARSGRPVTLRDVIEALVWPSVSPGGEESGEDTYMRFIVSLSVNHRALYVSALEGCRRSGYERCLAHIRDLLPHVPEAILDQRLVFLRIYLGAAMTARESAFNGGGRVFWTPRSTMEHFIDTIEAMLDAPVYARAEAVDGRMPGRPAFADAPLRPSTMLAGG